MLHNFFRTIYRHLLKNKTYGVINIAGLAIGMAAFILIIAYTHFEKSYDLDHKDADNIYRVESLFYKNGEVTDHWATSTNGYAKAMKADLPGIESFTRINRSNAERVVRYNEIKYREEQVCFADSNFFSFFSYPLLKGDASTILRDVNTIALSASAAKKYFGDADPLGKFLDISTISDKYHCMVTGIFKDCPRNSTLQFNFLISWNTSPAWQKDFWYQHESYTYVKLQPGASTAAIEAKFPAMAEKYKTADALKELTWAIDLVPLKEIHLNIAKPYETETKGNRKAVQLLGIIAFIILTIAWINYINLSIARAVDRAKEVGIRKVSGAGRSQLLIQFLLESFILNAVAFLVAIILVLAAIYFLPRFTNAGISSGLLFSKPLYLQCLFVFIAGVLLSGIYPALVLSRLKPILVLKGKYSFSKGGTFLRKGLVTLQFACSLVLIAGTFAMYRQVIYMNNQNPGVIIDQTLVIKAPVNTGNYKQKTGNFKNTLKSVPGVTHATGSGAIPGKHVGKSLANRREGASKLEDRLYEMLKVDFDFIPTYQPDIIAGRSFDPARPADSLGLVLNESAVKQFGFASAGEAIGKKIILEVNPGRSNEVIGVIKDYHQQSLQQNFTPLILFMDPAYDWIPSDYYSVRIKTTDAANTVSKIKTAWNEVFPESSFDFFFLDDYYSLQYRQDRQFNRIFLLFTSLAIFIACMGLFGLTAYTTARRTKEIGIRKVLGASVQHIISLLAWDSIKLILTAAIIGLPAAAVLIYQWLQGYAFRVSLSWWQFLLPLLSLLLIALATISWLTCNAALSNPSKTLKEE